MTYNKVQAFDYGLTNIPSLLNNESNQLKSVRNSILPKKEYLFYIPIFIHKTKWPVRAEFILKDKELFYKITAGADTVMVPCGGINFLN
jgi:tRNA A22 N-methylase